MKVVSKYQNGGVPGMGYSNYFDPKVVGALWDNIKRIPGIIYGVASRNINPNRGSGEIVSLKDSNMSEIRPETKDVDAIYANEFIELKPNTIRRAQDYISTNDTLLGDRSIPLSKIKYFYGVEDGQLKIGRPEVFHSGTKIIPVRNKTQPLKGLWRPSMDSVNPDEQKQKWDQYKRDTKKWSVNYQQNRDSVFERFREEHPQLNIPNMRNALHASWQGFNNENVNPFLRFSLGSVLGAVGTLVSPLSYFADDYPELYIYYNRVAQQQDNPKQFESATNITKQDMQELLERLQKADSTYQKNNPHPTPPLSNIPKGITLDNDTIDLDANLGNGKMFFVGQSPYFVSNLNYISNDDLQKINKDLQQHPAIPVMVDNGRYSDYHPDHGNYTEYTSMDFGRNPDHMYVIGTTKK